MKGWRRSIAGLSPRLRAWRCLLVLRHPNDPEAGIQLPAKAQACFSLNALPNWEAWKSAGASMPDVGVSGGPSGIRTQDRRIKSQWLQPQNSPKTASKNRETAGKQLKTAGKRQVSGHLPDTKWQQWQHLKKEGNAGLRPKEHTCANIATVRALTATICAGAVNPNASTLLHEIDRSARPATEVAI